MPSYQELQDEQDNKERRAERRNANRRAKAKAAKAKSAKANGHEQPTEDQGPPTNNPELTIEELAEAVGGKVSRDREWVNTSDGNGYIGGNNLSYALVKSGYPLHHGFYVHAKDESEDLFDVIEYVREKLGWPPYYIDCYTYQAADGSTFLKVFKRPKNGSGGKGRFRQAHYNREKGFWVFEKPDADPIPYRLPELIAAKPTEPIFICEGEKDADNVAALGLIATTNPEGATKWYDALNKWFEGRRVIVLPDKDERGEAHLQIVGNKLAGVASEVRVLRLPLKAEGAKDASDWISEVGDPKKAKRQLLALAKKAPVFEPSAEQPKAGPPPKRRIFYTAAELQQIEFPPLKFVVEGYIVDSCLSLLAGKPKIGKSWLCLDICLAVASGGTALGQIKCDEGDVLYAALEDNARRLQGCITKILRGRHDIVWPKRLKFMLEMSRLDQGGIEELRNWIAQADNPRLIAIDIFTRVKPPKGKNEAPYEADYKAMAMLQTLASETGVAIIVVLHLRKEGADDPFDTVSGTLGTTGGADTIMVLSRSSQGTTLRAKGRDIEELDKAVKFDRMSCCWIIEGDAAEVRLSRERRKIIEALRGSVDGRPMSPKELALAADIKPGSVRSLLHDMTKAGHVTRDSYGKYTLGDLADQAEPM